MPRMDGTGPNGDGPKTGRGLHNCQKANASTTFVGRGLGRRNIGGFSRGYGYRQTNSTKESLEQEKQILSNRITAIDEQLKK